MMLIKSQPELIPDPLLRRPLEIIYQGNGSGIRNEKQPNIRHAFGGPLYRWSFASAAVFPDQEARWLYEFVAHWSWTLCATALGINLGETYQKPQATSVKQQATSKNKA